MANVSTVGPYSRAAFTGGLKAQDLSTLLGFYKMGTVDDGRGNVQSTFGEEPEFEEWAAVRDKFGGETVTAERLQGRQPTILAVRSNGNTSQVTPEWIAKDQDGQVYEIRSLADPSGGGAWIEMLCWKRT